MDSTLVFKALADESRMSILKLLLQHNYCVKALARNLNLTESAISQHLKVLREAGILTGERKGYFMHYHVNRDILRQLITQIEGLSGIESELCTPVKGGCKEKEYQRCYVNKKYSSGKALVQQRDNVDYFERKSCKWHHSKEDV